MNTSEPENRVCEQCGAPLGRHLRQGFCSRCLARAFLLAEQELENKAACRKHLPGPELRPDKEDEPEVGGHPPSPERRRDEEVGEQAAIARFGDYELLEEIAHGGMGVVYRARQISLKRIVAVKMLLCGQFVGKNAFERFRAEAETAAGLQHPNIVAIHAIGETDGQPYFSMDYVAGRNLADMVRDHPLPAHQAATYLRTIARAVHYAHTQGVLHRDLKPANVLIDDNDEPRVTDFGIARRLVGDSEFTLTGQVVGSPNFMPPEQGGGKKAKLGPASDVYGLGALLYYLLTARPPFVADTFEGTLAQVLNTDPVAPRQLNPSLPLDLETICLKCLEKDPARRYQSAQELAEELDRLLKREPIHARPLGPIGKGWRWCRRKPALAAMTAAVAILLVTVTVVSLSAARRTEEKARELRLNLYVADMNVAYQAIQDNNLGQARQIVSQYVPRAQRAEDRKLKQAAADQPEDLRGWEWRYLWQMCKDDSMATFRGHTGAVSCAIFSRDGRTLITAGFDKTVRIWDVVSKRTLHVLTGFAGQLQRHSVAFSPHDEVLAVADGSTIQVFETTRWSKLQTLPNQALPGFVFSLPIAFSPDGRTLSCNAGSEVRHWDTITWNPRADGPANLKGEFGFVLAYAPDGRRFATGRDNGIELWDQSSSPPCQRSLGRPRWPTAVSFSANGRLVAAVGQDDFARVWSLENGNELLRLDMGPSLSMTVAISPDNTMLATGSGTVIRIWDLVQGQLVNTKLALSAVYALNFSPDGGSVVSACADGKAQLWHVGPKYDDGTISTPGAPLRFSSDGSIMTVLNTNRNVDYWDLPAGKLIDTYRIPVSTDQRGIVATSTDGGLIAHVSTDGSATVWQRPNGEQIARLTLQPAPNHPTMSFSPDHRLVVIGADTCARGDAGWVVVWDFRRGERRSLPRADVYRPAFSKDARILATGCGNDVQLWNIPNLEPTFTLKGHQATINSLLFSPNGALLASIGRDGEIRLWEFTTGQLKKVFHARSAGNGLSNLGFSPDGRTLASGGGGPPQLWNVASGKVALPLGGKHRYASPPIFSPDGNTLVIGGSQGLPEFAPVEIFRVPSLEEIDAAEGL